MPNTPLPPLQEDTQASAMDTSSSSNGNSLMPTLSRLSQSTSRPSILGERSDQGITNQTMRLGKEAWRRSGLSSLWRSNSDTEVNNNNKTEFSDRSTSRHSMESTSTISSLTKLRSQPLDTSSILYPTLTIHPPPVNHNILVLSLSHVNSAPPTLSNDELFNILLRRLEPWVGEEGEGGYVLIVLADEDGKGKEKEKETRKLPGIGWWVWRWKRLPRKYRKNLKRLYIVHPSLFTRTLLPFIVPFVSPKSYSKLHPLPSLLSLYHTHGVSLKEIDISLSALVAESRILQERPDLIPPTPTKNGSLGDRPPALKTVESQSSLASWGYQTISSAVETAASYLPLPHFGISNTSIYPEDKTVGISDRRGYWGRKLGEIMEDCNGAIPPLLITLDKVILGECTKTEGVFRRSSNSSLLPTIMAFLDLPIDQQPNLPWMEIAKQDPLLAPKLLNRFFKELDEPIITRDMYDVLRRTSTIKDIKTKFIPSLSSSTHQILSYIVHTLHHLSHHYESTKMTSMNLSIVISPVLISGPDPIEDTILCLEPSKPLPVGLKAMVEKNGIQQGSGTLVGLLDLWITNYPSISGSGSGSGEQIGLDGGCTCLRTKA